jgi:formylglycine-generating enzyme required for sulfatase activity
MLPRRCLLLVLPAALLLAVLPEGRSAPAPRKAKRFTNSVGMKFVLIPAGKFVMGSPNDETDRNAIEVPHTVEITRPFYMSVYLVTQAEYKKVIGSNPSHFCAAGPGRANVGGANTDRFPVERVSWNDALQFCAKLSARAGEKAAGRTYRLPTEAEWEYACRAGTTTPFHFGKSASSTQANFIGHYPYGGAAKGPYLQRTCKVGSYKPNAWGLYDMHGNVCQWCSDWYDTSYYKNSPKKDPKGPASASIRVLRGGSWLYSGSSCRAANRDGLGADGRQHFIGFRVACVLNRTP